MAYFRVTLIAVALAWSTQASGLPKRCTRPSAPSCMLTLSIERSADIRQLCRDSIEWFRRDVREYVKCLDAEQSDAIEEANQIVDRFNKCVNGPICI